MRRPTVTSLSILSALALLALAAGPGCGESDGPGQRSLTKEEARAAGGGKSDGVDYCQLFDWYDDGVCDEFCARPNPDCSPASCLPQACPLYLPVCETGYKVDDAGCATCECNDPPPPSCRNGGFLTCALYCPFGFKTDANGCSSCSCNPSPLDPVNPPTCSPVTCELYCENGFKTNADGCEICSCNEAPPANQCPPVLCTLFCENGFKKNADGCETCSCAEPEARAPATGQCVRNAGNSCNSDADCATGGCGGEVCFNPAQGNPVSTCDCTEPQGVACGCVNGSCAWYE